MKPVQTPFGPTHEKPAPAPKPKPAKTVGTREAAARQEREEMMREEKS